MHADLVEGLVDRVTEDVHKTLKRGGLDPDEDLEKYAEVLQTVIDDLMVDKVFLLEDEEDD